VSLDLAGIEGGRMTGEYGAILGREGRASVEIQRRKRGQFATWRSQRRKLSDVSGAMDPGRRNATLARWSSASLSSLAVHRDCKINPGPIHELSFPTSSTFDKSRQHVQLAEQDRPQQPLEAEPLGDRDQHRQRTLPDRPPILMPLLTLRRR
jgi:hypothetical protein